MNIASIDVGMKYLGFCLFRVENDSFKIVKWDTINLCNEKIYKCCGKTKKANLVIKQQDFLKMINTIAKYTQKNNLSKFLLLN